MAFGVCAAIAAAGISIAVLSTAMEKNIDLCGLRASSKAPVITGASGR